MTIISGVKNDICLITYLIPRLLAQARDNTCYEIGSKIEVGDFSSEGAHTLKCNFC